MPQISPAQLPLPFAHRTVKAFDRLRTTDTPPRDLTYLRAFHRRDEGKRYEQLTRIIQLMRRLEGRRYCPSMPELARDLGVCTRTVRRYLEAMSRAGLWVPPYLREYEREAAS